MIQGLQEMSNRVGLYWRPTEADPMASQYASLATADVASLPAKQSFARLAAFQ